MTNQGVWHIGSANCDAALQLYVDKNHELLVNVLNMTLATMIEFARHLVCTSCDLARFRNDALPVVGGPTQILAVDRMGKIVLQENC